MVEYYKGSSRKIPIALDPLRGTASGVPSGGGGGGGESSLTPFDFSTATKLMQTGWEDDITITQQSPGNQNADIKGIDNSVPVPNNWDVHYEQSGHLHDSRIYYEDGNASDRFAEIVTSPIDAATRGKVLSFELTNAAILKNGVPYKGRAQLSVSQLTGLKEIYWKTDMLFPAETGNLRSFAGTLSWFTIAELWNNKGQSVDPFRLTVAIHKPKAAVGSALRFSIHGQEKEGARWFPGQIWEFTNDTFAIPDDKWMKIEYYCLEGGEPGGGSPVGRFVMVVTVEGESPEVIFDIKRATRHTLQGTGGTHSDFNGFEQIQTHKLYAGLKEITHMQSLGKKLRLYFDNFEIWYQS